MHFLLAIKGFALSAIGKYVMIAIAGFIALALVRQNAAAPYKAEISQLRQAAADREKIELEDHRRAEANAAKAKELQNELDAILAAAAPGACRLSADELKRLQHLSKRNG